MNDRIPAPRRPDDELHTFCSPDWCDDVTAGLEWDHMTAPRIAHATETDTVLTWGLVRRDHRTTTADEYTCRPVQITFGVEDREFQRDLVDYGLPLCDPAQVRLLAAQLIALADEADALTAAAAH